MELKLWRLNLSKFKNVEHAFFNRLGGKSTGIFKSLNCGPGSSDNKKNILKKGSIIFWKGHVAICINSKKLIHAYGPQKKVLIMPILKTIHLLKIRKLKVLSIRRPQ